MALMSVEQLLNQAEDEYMSVDQLVFFKDRLEVKAAELRDRLLSGQASCEISVTRTKPTSLPMRKTERWQQA